jgi:hypothetical protein
MLVPIVAAVCSRGRQSHEHVEGCLDETRSDLPFVVPRRLGDARDELDVRAFVATNCPSCGGRMKAIAEITDKRVAWSMLEHVGLPSDAPEQWAEGASRRRAIAAPTREPPRSRRVTSTGPRFDFLCE